MPLYHSNRVPRTASGSRSDVCAVRSLTELLCVTAECDAPCDALPTEPVVSCNSRNCTEEIHPQILHWILYAEQFVNAKRSHYLNSLVRGFYVVISFKYRPSVLIKISLGFEKLLIRIYFSCEPLFATHIDWRLSLVVSASFRCLFLWRTILLATLPISVLHLFNSITLFDLGASSHACARAKHISAA